jgi:hypothetical protein
MILTTQSEILSLDRKKIEGSLLLDLELSAWCDLMSTYVQNASMCFRIVLSARGAILVFQCRRSKYVGGGVVGTF